MLITFPQPMPLGDIGKCNVLSAIPPGVCRPRDRVLLHHVRPCKAYSVVYAAIRSRISWSSAARSPIRRCWRSSTQALTCSR